jgi:biopolymer transport protein ExbB
MTLASFASVADFFAKGGFFMLLLGICSVVSLAVILHRASVLRRARVMPEVIEQAIEGLEPEGEGADRLMRLVSGDPSALGRIAHTCLRHLGWSKSENVEAVQTRARHEVVRLESGLVILEIAVGIGPLLGLLGTVSGLVTVFGHLGASSATTDPRGVAAGIAEALNTTIVGLCIAIPSLIAHSHFSRKVESMSAEMEALAAELLAKCYPAGVVPDRGEEKGR